MVNWNIPGTTDPTEQELSPPLFKFADQDPNISKIRSQLYLGRISVTLVLGQWDTSKQDFLRYSLSTHTPQLKKNMTNTKRNFTIAFIYYYKKNYMVKLLLDDFNGQVENKGAHRGMTGGTVLMIYEMTTTLLTLEVAGIYNNIKSICIPHRPIHRRI